MQLPERYQLVRRIANGGMASVWCAEDQVLGRRVAIKLLSDPFAYDDEAVWRFQREARVAARLSGHRHVITIYDVGSASDGRPFIVMEYLAGGTVADALHVGAVGREEAVRWIHEAAAALDYAHERGVVHRDIKPANMLLDCDRVLHVADFGIARIATDDTITRSDQVFGTAGYLAPERAVGRPATAASDRYSLAVAAFELLVGERPFTADAFAAQARQHLEEEPPRASQRNASLPLAVDVVLRRGMAKDPDDRWVTAGAFAHALEGAVNRRPARPARPRARAGAARVPVGAAAAARAPLRPGPAAAPTRTTRQPAPVARVSQPARAPAPPPAPAAAPAPAPPPAPAAPAPARFAAAATPVSVPFEGPARRHPRRRGLALAALAAGALAVAVISANQGSSGRLRRASQPRQVAAAPVHPARPAPAHPAAPATTPRPHHSTPAAGSGPSSAGAPPLSTADALEARGHALMAADSYQAAIPVLRRAVAAASPDSLTYAYALFDLGRSLRLAGDPRDAVQVLWQRMQIPNQTDVVRGELQLALQALGQQANGSSGGAAPGPGPAAPPAGPSAAAGAPHHD